jgi:hypothetical protein
MPDTDKQLLKNFGLATLPCAMTGLCLLLTLLFDQVSNKVKNYFIGVVLLQHATLPHLNTLNKNQPNPMAILMLLFVNVLQRVVVFMQQPFTDYSLCQCAPFTVKLSPLVHQRMVITCKPFKRICPCKTIVFLFKANTNDSVAK